MAKRKRQIDILVNFSFDLDEGLDPEKVSIELPSFQTEMGEEIGYVRVMYDGKGEIGQTSDFYTDEIVVQNDEVIEK